MSCAGYARPFSRSIAGSAARLPRSRRPRDRHGAALPQISSPSKPIGSARAPPKLGTPGLTCLVMPRVLVDPAGIPRRAGEALKGRGWDHAMSRVRASGTAPTREPILAKFRTRWEIVRRNRED